MSLNDLLAKVFSCIRTLLIDVVLVIFKICIYFYKCSKNILKV